MPCPGQARLVHVRTEHMPREHGDVHTLIHTHHTHAELLPRSVQKPDPAPTQVWCGGWFQNARMLGCSVAGDSKYKYRMPR